MRAPRTLLSCSCLVHRTHMFLKATAAASAACATAMHSSRRCIAALKGASVHLQERCHHLSAHGFKQSCCRHRQEPDTNIRENVVLHAASHNIGPITLHRQMWKMQHHVQTGLGTCQTRQHSPQGMQPGSAQGMGAPSPSSRPTGRSPAGRRWSVPHPAAPLHLPAPPLALPYS